MRSKIKAAIVVFPGTNCDRDCYDALSMLDEFDTEYVWADDYTNLNHDFIVLPGGFSYGDYLRAGAVAKVSPIIDKVKEQADCGKLVLGICNGFQVLTESGMLPGALTSNKGLKFICKDVFLRVDNAVTPFTSLYTEAKCVKFNIAHAAGNYYADDETINKLEKNNRIIFRYADEFGDIAESNNPNGSKSNIAGIINEKGNVLGLMPHPERSINKYSASEDGILMFKSVLNCLLQ